MERGLQMLEFDWWLCLIVAIFLFVNGVVGLVEDISHRRTWVLCVFHVLSIILGVVFTIWTV